MLWSLALEIELGALCQYFTKAVFLSPSTVLCNEHFCHCVLVLTGHRRPLLPWGRSNHHGQPQPLCSCPLWLCCNEGCTHRKPWGQVGTQTQVEMCSPKRILMWKHDLNSHHFKNKITSGRSTGVGSAVFPSLFGVPNYQPFCLYIVKNWFNYGFWDSTYILDKIIKRRREWKKPRFACTANVNKITLDFCFENVLSKLTVCSFESKYFLDIVAQTERKIHKRNKLDCKKPQISISLIVQTILLWLVNPVVVGLIYY